jgi:DNA-repair protein XRCC3
MSGITEIAGEAGAAKTQLALQLMLQSPLPQGRGGLCGGAIYLHGDTASCAPALKRLDTLAEAFAERHQDIGATAHRVKEMVYVMQVDSPDELWKIVHEKVPTLAAQTHIRLLVIDSVGGLYRTAADEAAAASGQQRASAQAERAQHLMRLAARLKQLSSQYSLAIVVTNQVSDKPLSSESRRTAAPWELGPCISSADGQSVRVPALGAAWACCVNTRIVLTRTPVLATGREYESGGAGAGGRSSWHRQLHVAWSPRVAETSVAFEVRDEGLVGLV